MIAFIQVGFSRSIHRGRFWVAGFLCAVVNVMVYLKPIFMNLLIVFCAQMQSPSPPSYNVGIGWAIALCVFLLHLHDPFLFIFRLLVCASSSSLLIFMHELVCIFSSF